MQTYDSQENVDVGIQLHNGDPTSVISLEQTSIAQFQVANVPRRETVFPNPSPIAECRDDLPILSVSMQLGVEKSGVEIMTTHIDSDAPAGHTPSSASSAPTDIERRHYSIVLYGCTEATYSCISNHGSEYQNLLQTELTSFQYYSRAHHPVFLRALHKLQPGSDVESMDWED
ncbi:hypothetical protein E1B28_010927 [Marasmius oreades]|uniref:Uncharacterized protein n=1 Tax=Marasmius oreades TaxID=181124 RepID=A0A9P7RU32_9AGAR|nr:uncharacterized protein E1B28_010927 [Marasmius oreades]KAG7089226.1 hypothetical protein E1B28_010927 [Marasmius oreades]